MVAFDARARFRACRLSLVPDSQAAQASWCLEFILLLRIISPPSSPFFMPGTVPMHCIISFNLHGDTLRKVLL